MQLQSGKLVVIKQLRPDASERFRFDEREHALNIRRKRILSKAHQEIANSLRREPTGMPVKE